MYLHLHNVFFLMRIKYSVILYIYYTIYTIFCLFQYFAIDKYKIYFLALTSLLLKLISNYFGLIISFVFMLNIYYIYINKYILHILGSHVANFSLLLFIISNSWLRIGLNNVPKAKIMLNIYDFFF